MRAKTTSPDAGHPTKDTPRPGRDVREDAHNETTAASANNPPNHGKPTNGINAFLLWVGETGRSRALDDLPDHYEVWRRQNESAQAELGRWSP